MTHLRVPLICADDCEAYHSNGNINNQQTHARVHTDVAIAGGCMCVYAEKAFTTRVSTTLPCSARTRFIYTQQRNKYIKQVYNKYVYLCVCVCVHDLCCPSGELES